MPGPLAIWAAKKALQSKTGQRLKAQAMGAVGDLKDDVMSRGHAALSTRQFPASPHWGAPPPVAVRPAPAPPWGDPTPRTKRPAVDPPPPW